MPTNNTLTIRLIQDLTHLLSTKYTLPTSTIRQITETELQKNSPPAVRLRRLLSAPQPSTPEKLRKTSAYKQFYKLISKKVYTRARTYHRPRSTGATTPLSTLEAHTSTAERQPNLTQFFQPLRDLLKPAQYIVDIGSGIFPLQFDYSSTPNLQTYLAIERNTRSMEILKQNADRLPRQVSTIHSDIGNIDWDEVLMKYTRNRSFDIAFMLKTVAVIMRQRQSTALSRLLTTPANTLVLSGNKRSLTKGRSIIAREKRTLLEFIQKSGRKILQQYETGDEIVYVVS